MLRNDSIHVGCYVMTAHTWGVLNDGTHIDVT